MRNSYNVFFGKPEWGKSLGGLSVIDGIIVSKLIFKKQKVRM
jgi:hypothetical protein